MQADVDDYYGMFTAEVAKGRGVDQSAVQQGYGEGRSLHARQAVAAGLADRAEVQVVAMRAREGADHDLAALGRRPRKSGQARQLLKRRSLSPPHLRKSAVRRLLS